MSTRPVPSAAMPPDFIVLPDAPRPDDVNNSEYLHIPGNSHYLAEHLGNSGTTIVSGEALIRRTPTDESRGLLAPDLFVAFNADHGLYVRRRGYVIADHGKPPDFVLEIGSSSTGEHDVTFKRDGYAALGIPEYWRFDPSGGEYHGAPLAGDQLTAGNVYEPIPIERIGGRTFQGYSAVLNLHLRWEEGRLLWFDPATGRHITRLRDERELRLSAEARADRAEARANNAESRVRELEEELRRQRGQ